MTQPTMKIPQVFTPQQERDLWKNPTYRNNANACPTCEGTGIYKLDGKDYPCPQDSFGDIQQRLFKLYCLANIPYEFMTLDWTKYPHEAAKEKIDFWVAHYSEVRRHGMGYELYGGHGTGKTWAAAHMLMEVVKQGYTGWYIQFAQLKGLYERDDEEKHFNLKRIRESEVLVIDDVTEPWSEPMREFYAEKLEDAIRARVHSNFPTIVTTNMSQAKWKDNYPRVHAQLSGKQLRLRITGEDYRGHRQDWIDELIRRGEREPIV